MTNPQEDQTPNVDELLEHRERQIAALRRISEALLSQVKIDDLLRETLNVAVEVLKATVGSLQMHDPRTDALVFRHVTSASDTHLVGFSIPTSKGISGQVFLSGLSNLTNKVGQNVEFNPEVDEKSGTRTHSMLTVPLKRPDGKSIGVLQVLNSRTHFDELDLEVLEVLGAQAAMSIENARLAQEARKAEIVNVIGNISHDIKNMLTPIQSGIWTLQTLLEDASESVTGVCRNCPPDETWGAQITQALDAFGADFAWITESALDSSERVQDFTRDLADAVKGEIAPPVFERGDLNCTVQDVARTLQLTAEKAGVRLGLDLDAALPPLAFDRKQIHSALYNLVNNAVPETPQGGSVTIRTRREGEATILLQVQDTGRGIPDDVRSRLFTEQAISTKVGGTGLGTRIIAGVVQRHNGTITVESEVGRGSTFSIRLPLQRP